MTQRSAHPEATHTEAEILSQPEVWSASLPQAGELREIIAAPGERVLFIGCGTSAFMAQELAELRERAGLGESHWAYASELPVGRAYDRVVALTRSGTTTEVLSALRDLAGTARLSAVVAVAGMPVEDLVSDVVVLDRADEQSVVQTRFPTTLVFLARAAYGEDVSALPGQLEEALSQPIPDVADVQHFVTLARSPWVGFAHEAALKIRESAQAWAESYPAMDYRHGPISVAGDRSLVTILGDEPEGLRADVEAVGATVFAPEGDPLVQLVQCQRIALAAAITRGLNPDEPRHLSRSIILPS